MHRVIEFGLGHFVKGGLVEEDRGVFRHRQACDLG